MALSRAQITAPHLPQEEIPFPPLNGDVLVRGISLSQWLANDRLHHFERQPLAGETEDQARARAGSRVVTRVLHQTVIDPNTLDPLLSAEEWDRFGLAHREDVLRIFNHAMRLSGDNLEAVEKN